MKRCVLLMLLALVEPCAAESLQPVVLQLNWKHQFEFAAFYAAIERGYYRDAGLDVQVQEGGPGIDVVQRVVDGEAEFAIGNSSLVVERSRGKPVVALAALMQHSAIVLVAPRGLGIDSVGDLQDRRIAVSPHARDEVIAYLLASGLRESALRFVPQPPVGDQLFPPQAGFAAREIYSTNQAFLLRAREHEFITFTPRSQGIDLFGNLLFTSDAMLDRDPALVRRFRDASLRGLEYAMAHRPQLADLIRERYNSQGKSREHLLFEADKLHDLTRLDLVDAGYMGRARWQHVADTYAGLNLLPADFKLDGLLRASDEAVYPEWLRTALLIASGGLLLALGGGYQLGRMNRRLRREVAERSAAESALRRNQEEFREFSAQSHALLNHDLRTPLANIKAHLDLLRPRLQRGGESAHNLDAIGGAVRRLELLIEDRLQLTHAAARPVPARRAVDLHTLLPRLTLEVAESHPRARIRWHGDGAPLRVIATPELLHSALFALLDHALHAAASGSEVDLWLIRDGSQARIEVAYPAGERAALFEQCFDPPPAEPAATPGKTRSGALYPVRLIVEAQGGTAGVQRQIRDRIALQLEFPLLHPLQALPS